VVGAIWAVIQADTTAAVAENGTGRRGIAPWDDGYVPPPLTSNQRTTVVSSLVAGTPPSTLSNCMTLIASASSATVTQAQVWRILAGYNDATSN
jgi:hypothetical protein